MLAYFLSLIIVFKHAFQSKGFKFIALNVENNDNLNMMFMLNDDQYSLYFSHNELIKYGKIYIKLEKENKGKSEREWEDINVTFSADSDTDINSIPIILLSLIPDYVFGIKHEVKEAEYYFKKQCSECDDIYYSNFITKAQYENICYNDHLVSGLDGDGNYTAIIKSKCNKCVQ
jgi:hypothetical protein